MWRNYGIQIVARSVLLEPLIVIAKLNHAARQQSLDQHGIRNLYRLHQRTRVAHHRVGLRLRKMLERRGVLQRRIESGRNRADLLNGCRTTASTAATAAATA